jgi:hypothetical protein
VKKEKGTPIDAGLRLKAEEQLKRKKKEAAPPSGEGTDESLPPARRYSPAGRENVHGVSGIDNGHTSPTFSHLPFKWPL